MFIPLRTCVWEKRSLTLLAICFLSCMSIHAMQEEQEVSCDGCQSMETSRSQTCPLDLAVLQNNLAVVRVHDHSDAGVLAYLWMRALMCRYTVELWKHGVLPEESTRAMWHINYSEARRCRSFAVRIDDGCAQCPASVYGICTPFGIACLTKDNESNNTDLQKADLRFFVGLDCSEKKGVAKRIKDKGRWRLKRLYTDYTIAGLRNPDKRLPGFSLPERGVAERRVAFDAARERCAGMGDDLIMRLLGVSV